MRLLNASIEEAMTPVVDNFELDDHLERQTARLVLGQQQKILQRCNTLNSLKSY